MKIGNIQNLPWYSRIGVLGGAAVLLYLGFWYFVTSSTRAETKNLNDQIAVLLPQNQQAQIASQRLNEFRAVYRSRQEEYDELKALLPEQRELTAVLQGVQDRARASQLSLRRFSPKDDIQQDFYAGKPIEVEVTSSFASLRAFFEQLAKYQRIVSISDFKLNQLDDKDQAGGKTVNAQFLMTAYYVSAEKLQKTPPTPGAPAPANGATPPPAPAK